MKVVTNDQETRKEYKEKMSQKVSEALEPVIEEESLSLVEVEVPSNFWQLSDLQLYGILKFQQLTPEQAKTVVEQLRGLTSSTEFKLVLQSPVAEPIKKLTLVEAPEEESISVQLPSTFKDMKSKDQYLYLTKEKLLLPEHANDIIDWMNDKPVLSKVSYNISFGE